MTITVLQEGSLAKSSTLNNNFSDLQNQISTISATSYLISQSLSSLANNVSTISATVANNALSSFQLSQNNTVSGTNIFSGDVTFSGDVNFSGNVTRNWGSDTVSATEPAVIIETYKSTISASGYNVYSNGYCEQWGIYDNGTTTDYLEKTVTLIKTYNSTNYLVLISIDDVSTGGYGNMIAWRTRTENGFGFKVSPKPDYHGQTRYICWKTIGYIN